MRDEVRKMRSKLREKPAELSKIMKHQAQHLDELATDPKDLPPGLRETMEDLSKARSRGESVTSLGGKPFQVPSYTTPLESWYQWFMTDLDTVLTYVHLHQLASASIMIFMATGRSDAEGILQPIIYLEGLPATGKSMISSTVMKAYFAHFNQIAHESKLAQAGGEHRRGGGDSYDECNLAAIGAEHAGSLNDIYRRIARRELSSSYLSGQVLQQATSATTTINYLNYSKDGKRQSIITVATSMRATMRMSNEPISCAPENQQRRGFFFTVVHPPHGVTDVVSRQSNPSEARETQGPARVLFDRTMRTLGNLTLVANTLNYAEVMAVNATAAAQCYDTSSAPGWTRTPARYRHANPFQKFRQVLSPGSVMHAAMCSFLHGLNAPDPLRAISPFTDVFGMRELLYATEASACLAMDVLLGPATAQHMPPGMAIVVQRLRQRFRRFPDKPEGPDNPIVKTLSSHPDVQYCEEYAVLKDIFLGHKTPASQLVHLGKLLHNDANGRELLHGTVHVCICHLLSGAVCRADETGDSRCLPSIIFKGRDLLVLRSLLEGARASRVSRRDWLTSALADPVKNELLSFKARAFAPGTRHMVCHKSLNVDPLKPSKMTTVEMTYETYRAIMLENDDRDRDQVFKAAETGLIKATQDAWSRAGVSWLNSVRSILPQTGEEFVSYIMNTYRDTQAHPDQFNDLVGQWVDQQPKAVADVATISNARTAFLQKLGANAQLRKAIMDFWSARVANEQLHGLAGEDCLPEEIWSRQTKRNTAFADMEDIKQQIRLGVFHPNSIDQFSDKPLVPFQADPFRKDCRQHLLSCGVKSEEIEFRWSYIDNRAMLEELCMRRNRARDVLIDAIHSYKRTDTSLREAVLRGVICMAWEAGMFYAHLYALDGLRFGITRDHIALFYREKYWDILNAMEIRADEFYEAEDSGVSDDDEEEGGPKEDRTVFSVEILADLFIDITVCVVTHLTYAYRTEDGEVQFHETGISDGDIQDKVRQCIPVPMPSEQWTPKDPDDIKSGELYVMDVFMCATVRPDANQFLVPIYADGRVVPSSALDDRLALHQVTIRRIAFRDAARDFFVDRLLEQLSPKWSMVIDTGSRRSEVLDWLFVYGDIQMCERAYAMRNIFECIRMRKYETARQIQAGLHPVLRMPPLAPCYPWEAEMDLVRAIIGRAPAPHFKELDPVMDWNSLMSLGGVQLPPEADAIEADGGDQARPDAVAAEDGDEAMDDREPLEPIQEEAVAEGAEDEEDEEDDVLDETAAGDMEVVVPQPESEEEEEERRGGEEEEAEESGDPAAEFVDVNEEAIADTGEDWVAGGEVADDELLNQL